jgi:acetoin utilization deacetylase AcuC-like enzyme
MGEIPWNNLIFYYHPIFQQHLVGVQHPEKPQRLQIIIDYLKERQIWDKIQIKSPQPAELKWIESNHSSEYIEHVKQACLKSPAILDGGDTIVTEKSFQAALYASGSALNGIDDLLQGNAKSVFCAVRPPGHHAEYAYAMGFCLFNNVAIAARYAIEGYGLSRIFILDWDVHHGNGTQNSFEDDPKVFFTSLHESPLYPGTGSISEIGRGKAEGFNRNFPIVSGSGDEDYISILNSKIIPLLDEFQPELLIISAGFDAHRNDPLASMNLSTKCYGQMTLILREEMLKHNDGKLLSVLEGGYHLEHLAESVYAHLEALVLSI